MRPDPVRRFVAVAVAALVLLPASLRAETRPDECYAPKSVVSRGSHLQKTGTRLITGEPVKIVAFGSSSTAGAGASDKAHTYPSQLAVELQTRFPQSKVTILNRGVNGEQTQDMLDRLDRDVIAEHPDLVIWQTGSNEILRKSDSKTFRRLVISGVERLKAAGIEVILMDAQYAPRILDNPEYPLFNETLRRIARSVHVALFDRFEAMRFWLASKRQAWSHIVGKDKVHMTDAGYRCVARLVASLIAAEVPAVATR